MFSTQNTSKVSGINLIYTWYNLHTVQYDEYIVGVDLQDLFFSFPNPFSSVCFGQVDLDQSSVLSLSTQK